VTHAPRRSRYNRPGSKAGEMEISQMIGSLRGGRRLAAMAALVLLSACAGAGQRESAPPLEMHSALGSYLAARHAQVDHDYTRAAQFTDRALASDPGNYELVRRAFLLRLTEGKVEEAAPLARRLVAIDGKTGLAGLVLLEQEMKAGHYDVAARDAAAMPREGGLRFAVPVFEAWAQAGLGHPAQATKILETLGGTTGLQPLADLHTALIDDYAGRIDAASAAYEKLIAGSQPPTWRVAELTGNFFERHGRAGDARRLYQRSAAARGAADVAAMGIQRIDHGVVPAPLIASPKDGAGEGLFDLAGLLNQSETADAALVYARLALDLSPRLALAQLMVAEIRDSEGRPADALALYQAVDPKSPYAWMARLRAALELDVLDRTDEAVAQLKAMAAERPGNAEVLVELGDILRAHKRFTEAVAVYDQAIARTPHLQSADWRLFYSRGVALERSGQWERAEADLKRALALAPDQPLVLNYLGYSWIDRGENLHDALGMIQRAVALRPEDGYIIDSLGWAYFRLGDYKQATHYLERAIELLPEDPTINDHLGDAYWRVDRQAEARFQWRRALQFQPAADEVKGIEAKLEHGLAATKPEAVRGG
jgi:tetratricopeptide (TPR) repeat protein